MWARAAFGMVSGGGVLPPPPVSPVFAPPCPVFASAPAVPAVLCHTLAELHLWFGHVPAKLCYLEERTIDHFWRSLRLLPGHPLPPHFPSPSSTSSPTQFSAFPAPVSPPGAPSASSVPPSVLGTPSSPSGRTPTPSHPPTFSHASPSTQSHLETQKGTFWLTFVELKRYLKGT